MQLNHPAPFGVESTAPGASHCEDFCRSFDFELQAAATDDGILLSLGEQHSFPCSRFSISFRPTPSRTCLTQAVGCRRRCSAPAFGGPRPRPRALSNVAWERVPPPIQRARAEDLIAAVFPSRWGSRQHGGRDFGASDHPLVTESLKIVCAKDGRRRPASGAARAQEGFESRGSRSTCPASVFAHAMLTRRLTLISMRHRLKNGARVRSRCAEKRSPSRPPLSARSMRRDRSGHRRRPARDSETSKKFHDCVCSGVDGGLGRRAVLAQLRVGKRARAAHRPKGNTSPTPLSGSRGGAVFPGAVLELARSKATPARREVAIARWCRLVLKCGPTTAAELAAKLCVPEAEVEQASTRWSRWARCFGGGFGSEHRGGGAIAGCSNAIHRQTVGGCVGKSSRSHRQT